MFSDENGFHQSVTDGLEVHIQNHIIGPEKKGNKTTEGSERAIGSDNLQAR